MKNPLAVLLGVVICSVSIPIMISIVSYKDIEKSTITDSLQKPNIKNEESIADKKVDKKSPVANYETVDKKSPTITIYNHKLGKNQQMDMEEYLCGVLSGEMSVKFDMEALKAQAVAARTFVVYKEKQSSSSKHKNAVVCTDFRHCQEYKSYDELEKINGEKWMKSSYPKIQKAVKETKGQIITYDNQPILPLYFSTSSGKTENSEEVFSAQYPYLKSVDSPYDKNAPKYSSTVEFTYNEFVDTLKKSYKDIQIDVNQLSSQVNILQRSNGGAVEDIKIGNKEVKGVDIRSIFKLNSANFDIEFENEKVKFIVKGYGHGVGMSQWGAQGMAEEGYKYYEIISHYYTGTDIKDTY